VPQHTAVVRIEISMRKKLAPGCMSISREGVVGGRRSTLPF
jgi:hypothetical protein